MLTVIGAFSVMGDIWADQIDQSKGPVTNSLWLQVHGHQGPMVGPGDLERVPCFVTCRYIMGICSNIIIISTLLFDVIIYRSLCRHCDDDGDGHDSDDSHGDELLTVVCHYVAKGCDIRDALGLVGKVLRSVKSYP